MWMYCNRFQNDSTNYNIYVIIHICIFQECSPKSRFVQSALIKKTYFHIITTNKSKSLIVGIEKSNVLIKTYASRLTMWSLFGLLHQTHENIRDLPIVWNCQCSFFQCMSLGSHLVTKFPRSWIFSYISRSVNSNHFNLCVSDFACVTRF